MWSSISWKEILSPKEKERAKEYEVDHIAPQESPDNERLLRLNEDDAIQRPFKEIFLHRLGNLVLDSRSAGASKGNKPFHECPYTESTLRSQQELKTYASEMNETLIWDEKAIKKREERIVKFAEEEWLPSLS